jgi:hypothetical protein
MTNEITYYLDNNNPEAFLEFVAGKEPSYWENFENLTILTKSIKIEHLGLRDYIYRIILNISDDMKPFAAEHLTPYLLESNKEVRNLVADLLMKLGEHSNPPLIELLKHDDVDVKKFASDILGFTGTDLEIPSLVMLLSDDDLNVFNSAIESIGRIFDRNKDKIGLAESTTDILIGIYDLDNFDTKPTIIEAISKIGGSKALDFLIGILNDDDDLFIRTTVIDGLAICGDNPQLCELLIKDIHNYIPELQPVVLKTIVAIAFRIGFELKFDDDFRKISYLALTDDDPDARTAGLLSLGTEYKPEDLKLILNEYFNSSEELQYYIINNIINYNIDLYDNFLKLFINNSNHSDSYHSLVEMLGLIQNFISEVDDDIQYKMFAITVENLEHQLTFGEKDTFETLRLMNPETFDRLIDNLIIDKPSEISEKYSELKNDLQNH